jgi:hypothetical protein
MPDPAWVVTEQVKPATSPAYLKTDQTFVRIDLTYRLFSRNTAGVVDARAAGFPFRVQTL